MNKIILDFAYRPFDHAGGAKIVIHNSRPRNMNTSYTRKNVEIDQNNDHKKAVNFF